MAEIESKKKTSSSFLKKLILIIVGIIFLGIAIYFSPLMNNIRTVVEKQKNKNDLVNTGFLVLPEILVNLKPYNGKTSILKATFTLKLQFFEDKAAIEHLRPLILDQFQTYLREQYLKDIEGGIGIEKVKQSLLSRVNIAIHPLKIERILIKDFLIQ